ncbi:MAG: hypothetical protein ABIR54_18690 [Burkholderiaceae bacterium]|jgi:hypothetical protein
MSSFSPATFRRVVQASAVYDVLVTAPFATPWSFAWNWGQLSALNARLGGATLAPFDVFPTLIACLLGSIVLVWSALRIARPEIRLGRHDAVARFLFSAWMAWALHVTGAPLLWFFLVPEFAWGVVQWWPVDREGRVS